MAIAVSTGRRTLPLGGPPGSGLVWTRPVGAGGREEDPGWFAFATDHYWTFYVLLTDEICGISHEPSTLDTGLPGATATAALALTQEGYAATATAAAFAADLAAAAATANVEFNEADEKNAACVRATTAASVATACAAGEG